MARKLVQNTISILAPAGVVWRIITGEEYNVRWLAAFGEGNVALTDWQEGSKAVFVDGSNSGLITRIKESRPFETILMQNIGIITDGKEDYESEEAIESQAFFERYLLTSEGDATRLSVEVVVEDDFFDKTSASWKKALATIKLQAESEEN